ncbi:hypothetical protein BH20CHL6_BH20CHL6_17720 [soil metagenome]
MRSEAWTWFVRGLGFALAVAMIAGLASGVLAAGKGVVLVVISILLAAGLEPFVGWLRGRTGMGRSTTILVVYAAFFVLALGVAFLVVPVAINQFNELGTRLPPLSAGSFVGALLAVPLMAAAVVLLERLQARDSPVMLESHGGGENPSQTERAELGKKRPDARPSSGGPR